MRICLLCWLTLAVVAGDLEKARDAQDRAALSALATQFGANAAKQPGPKAFYMAALANSYAAEVATELADKGAAKTAAEAGIEAARKAVAAEPNNAEYHRILGTLCGQVIPANVLVGLKYGGCAKDEITKALELDPKAAMNHVSQGVGNYYLPPALGGGVEKAIQDFQKAISLDSKSAEGYLWLGIALRKAGRNAEAHQALEKALSLNPDRVFVKQQLAKTPAK